AAPPRIPEAKRSRAGAVRLKYDEPLRRPFPKTGCGATAATMCEARFVTATCHCAAVHVVPLEGLIGRPETFSVLKAAVRGRRDRPRRSRSTRAVAPPATPGRRRRRTTPG